MSVYRNFLIYYPSLCFLAWTWFPGDESTFPGMTRLFVVGIYWRRLYAYTKEEVEMVLTTRNRSKNDLQTLCQQAGLSLRIFLCCKPGPDVTRKHHCRQGSALYLRVSADCPAVLWPWADYLRGRGRARSRCAVPGITRSPTGLPICGAETDTTSPTE